VGHAAVRSWGGLYFGSARVCSPSIPQLGSVTVCDLLQAIDLKRAVSFPTPSSSLYSSYLSHTSHRIRVHRYVFVVEHTFFILNINATWTNFSILLSKFFFLFFPAAKREIRLCDIFSTPKKEKKRKPHTGTKIEEENDQLVAHLDRSAPEPAGAVP
jgi:hypothetical protein